MTDLESLRAAKEPGSDDKAIAAAKEPGSDDKAIAHHCLHHAGGKGRCFDYDKLAKRSHPCADCAVIHGLYTSIAAACYRELNNSGCKYVVEHWDCHNGGRCQGAAIVMGVE